MTEHPRIPTATYRLQFNRQFTFADARAITPYLHALGISDAYASPYFQARAESLHGYDITDHNKLNPAIGSREEYDAWVAELHARRMGQVLDFVPNHMGIGEPLNTWWQDVLENGPSSAFADFFDIDWHPIKSELHDKVLIPTLGDQYGRVLERGELKVRYDAGTFYLCYYQHEFPIAPGTYRFILDRALEILEPDKEKDYYAELQSIRTALEYLPKRTEIDPERIAERGREKEIIKRRLDRRCQEAPQVLHAIEQALEQINGIPGEPRSFDALDELLNAQAYRLSFWRVAAEEINYRRFFDVNDLAAIRMELPEVFDATHTLLLELVAARAVTGVRIDHPDGLYLPGEYFRKLQHRCAEALGIELPKDGRAIYMIVEKILTGRERLPKEWPVHGTTGYDFATLLTQLLVDGSSEQAITKTYRRFIGHSMHFGHLAYAKKRLITRLSLANDVAVLGSMLDRLSETNRWFRDFTLQQLQIAVRETIACFPVYRTYVGPGEPVREEDRAVIERAISTAKRRNPGIEESVFNYLRDILQLKFPENFDEEARAAHTHFVLKFQQATGPITAKGIEDTTFYVYNRLAALNEVGGEPQQFGCSIDDFHQENAERLANWPATLLATSTHDTKRSEDVRARMLAISELSDVWRTSVLRWRTLNRRAKKTVDDAEAPDANEEYLFYQTLLGTWPVDSSGKPEQTASPEFIQRIQEYMGKALKEAKINTSWVQPREPWDNAMRDFIATTLEASPRNRFLPALFPLAEEIARLGAINSLSQLVLKLTVPGVPDVYQGNELWDFSLVDPDNRRPVDYSHRQQMLASLGNTQPHELLEHWPDGRIKLLATTRLLTFRREHADLFRRGTYTPLQTLGTFADSCIAFAREREGESLVVIVPRLTARVGFPPVAEKWQDTAVQLPNSFTAARELFTGRELTHDNGRLALAEALRVLPFAAYVAKA
ncbi:MAG: malto-oligosyltrehalose synthase [Chthoniobacterales bacterium]